MSKRKVPASSVVDKPTKIAKAIADHEQGLISDDDMILAWSRSLREGEAKEGDEVSWHTCIYALNPFSYQSVSETADERNNRILEDSLEMGVSAESIANWGKTVSQLIDEGLLKSNHPMPGSKTLWELDMHPMEFPINVVKV